MRFVVFGAGAIGGTIGALLHEAGNEVALIARGAHLRHLRESGLTLKRPDGSKVLAIPAYGSPDEVGDYTDTTVILAVKSQDSTHALDALEGPAARTTSIVCAQNGVDNERQALRRFEDVTSMCVMLPASHLHPGTIYSFGMPHPGVVDVGRYPHGESISSIAVAAALVEAGFASDSRRDIMRFKYHKLIRNVVNALEALVGTDAAADNIADRANSEASQVLARAGIDVASASEFAERRKGLARTVEFGNASRGGRSTWQSLRRATGTIETDYLNGEITMLGRLYGVSTPVNAVLQSEAKRVAKLGLPPGSLSVADLQKMIDQA